MGTLWQAVFSCPGKTGSYPKERKRMNLLTTIIACLMVGDAIFATLNLARLESLIHQLFPQLNLKKVALVEGLVGGAILLFKILTDSLS